MNGYNFLCYEFMTFRKSFGKMCRFLISIFLSIALIWWYKFYFSGLKKDLLEEFLLMTFHDQASQIDNHHFLSHDQTSSQKQFYL